jgi:hypothetical protein
VDVFISNNRPLFQCTTNINPPQPNPTPTADTKELRFVLTPANIWGEDDLDMLDWDSDAEEADQDLFLSTSRAKQPGETSFDLTAQTWAGVDEIVFSEEEAGEAWCTDCMVRGSVGGVDEWGWGDKGEGRVGERGSV